MVQNMFNYLEFLMMILSQCLFNADPNEHGDDTSNVDEDGENVLSAHFSTRFNFRLKTNYDLFHA